MDLLKIATEAHAQYSHLKDREYQKAKKEYVDSSPYPAAAALSAIGGLAGGLIGGTAGSFSRKTVVPLAAAGLAAGMGVGAYAKLRPYYSDKGAYKAERGEYFDKENLPDAYENVPGSPYNRYGGKDK